MSAQRVNTEAGPVCENGGDDFEDQLLPGSQSADVVEQASPENDQRRWHQRQSRLPARFHIDVYVSIRRNRDEAQRDDIRKNDPYAAKTRDLVGMTFSAAVRTIDKSRALRQIANEWSKDKSKEEGHAGGVKQRQHLTCFLQAPL